MTLGRRKLIKIAGGSAIGLAVSGKSNLLTLDASASNSSIFDPRLVNGKRVALYSDYHKKYVVAENSGNSPLNASKSAIGEWEIFTIIAIDGQTLALRSNANGRYVTAENAGNAALIARGTEIGAWERFRLFQRSDNQFSIQAVVNNQYIRVPNGQGSPLMTDRSSVGAYEVFNIAWLDIDLLRAVRAFAVNFPKKVKSHTLGILEADRGILFHTEKIINGKLWFYEAFPKSDRGTFPDGYQHVWNGILIESDGYISGDCTIPYKQGGEHWIPAIPRTHRFQPVGIHVETKRVSSQRFRVSTDGSISPVGTATFFGVVNPPTMINLSDSRSELNMDRRWVLELGLNGGPERWAVDLGPSIGVFDPKFGMVGYHSASDWSDKRYFANIHSRSINENRRYDGTRQM